MKNSRLEVGHTNLQALKLKKSALSEKNKHLSQEFMKMKAQKVLEWVFIMLIM
jgi:hypothetical protein